MSATGFRYLPFDCPGSHEYFLVHGPDDGPELLLIQPLFEEINFLRAAIVDMARALAAMGIRSWIPDLPGTGESLRPLETIGWQDWREAVAAAAQAIRERTGRKPHVASLRGGALLDDAADAASWWRAAPADGHSLLRHLQRAQLIHDRENDVQSSENIRKISGPIALAGYIIAPSLRDPLNAAEPAPSLAPLRLWDDREGSAPLWRRAEPGRDSALSDRMAADIAGWITSCAAS